MADDPLSWVVDAPLFIVPRVLDGLRAYRARAKPGDDPVAAALDGLVDTLLNGIAAQPTKFWVMRQFQKTLERIGDADAPARRRACTELEKLMDLLGIRSSDGLLGPDRH